MAHSSSPVATLDTLGFVGLERSHLRSAVYRRVFGDDTGPVLIGRYSILERIGSGARGVVFKAFDNQLDRLVALKVLSTRADHQAELLREAKALARLSHPNVLPVYEVGRTEDGQVFLATEYVKGWTLRGWYDEEHRSEASILDVMRQVADGVQAAHDEGLVHRDLKPANILLGADGRVRVADFGLARFDPSAVDPSGVPVGDGATTTTAGTPGYMAPELFEGKPASVASDQYALAVTLHELLFGHLPGRAEKGARRQSRISSALRRGLCVAPEDRFPSVADFADAIDRRIARGTRRGVMVVAAGLLALGGVAAGAVALSAAPVDQTSSEFARLKAKAELPDRPAAALQALRSAHDIDHPSLLPVAEHALSLSPATTRFALPKEAEHPRLFGELVFHRSGDALLGHRLSQFDASPVDPGQLGLSGAPSNLVVSPTRVHLDADASLRHHHPWAFENYDHQEDLVAASRDGSHLARFDPSEHRVVVTRLDDGVETWSTSPEPSTTVRFVELDVDGDRVAWGLAGGHVYLHDLRTDVTSELEASASHVLFEASEDTVLVRGRDAGVYRLRLSDGQRTHLLPAGTAYGDVLVSPDRAWVAAVDSSRSTVLATQSEGTPPIELGGGTFAFSPDSRFLAAVGDGRVRLLHLQSGDVAEIPSGGAVDFVQFGSDGALWALGNDGYVRRHEPEAPHVLAGHTESVTHIALSHDGREAVSLGRDFTLRAWDVEKETGRVLAELDWSGHGLTLDEAASRVAVVQLRGDTHIFDLRTGQEIGTAPPSSSAPSLGPGGALIGASSVGVWSNLDGATTMIADDVGRCVASTATEALVAAICGNDDAFALHLWTNGEHGQIPVDTPEMGDALHVWPDSRHLLRFGRHKTLFAFSEDARLVPDGRADSLPKGQPYTTPSTSAPYGDLLFGDRTTIYSVWGRQEEPIALASAPFGLPSISSDGRTFGYANDTKIVVRRRQLSAARPDLSEVLAAHELVEGEL